MYGIIYNLSVYVKMRKKCYINDESIQNYVIENKQNFRFMNLYQDILEYFYLSLDYPELVRKFVCLNHQCYRIGQKYIEEKKQQLSIKNIKYLYYNSPQIYYRLPNGWKHGLCQEWWQNGQLRCKINYINNIQQGKFQAWWTNGHRWNEYYVTNGIINGVYTRWKENGELESECVFENNKTIKVKWY